MAEFSETTPGEVNQKLTAGDSFLLLDCREEQEYALATVRAAKLLPMSELATRVDDLAEYREQPVVVMCHHGMRSAQVAAWLVTQGFKNVSSMAGGIDQWSQDVDPEVPRY